MNLSKTIGFIGAGQMAEALARGFAARGIATPAQMWATDPVAARRDVFADFGATAVETNVEV
jgi:pyrroline-5-carboxylate reductase